MNTSIAMTSPQVRMRHPTLRMITVGALILNALVFVYDLIQHGPNGLNLSHIFPTMLIVAIVAYRFRWSPLVGAFVSGALFLEGYMFIRDMITQPATAADFAFAAIFFASAAVGLVAGIAATVQNYRVPRIRPFVDQPTPEWTVPALLAVVTLVFGGIMTTAIQPRGTLPGVSDETLAALPALTTKDYVFEQSTITAKVGETVVLRLDNADTSTHYLDIDEFNVHAIMPAGKSNVAIFKPTEAGTFTFYCRPHANKEAGTGMVGTLIVEP